MGKGKTKPKAIVIDLDEEVDEKKLTEIMGALVKVPPKKRAKKKPKK